MSTQAQIDANRQNSLKSTGPTTEEGKAKSGRNSITHGCTRKTVDPPEMMGPAYHETLAEFTAQYQPTTPERSAFLELAVRMFLQTRTCFEAIHGEMAKQRQIAEKRWDETHLSEAYKLLAKLSKNPVQIAAELRESHAGCLVMIEKWQMLKDEVANLGEWNDAQVAAAFDLLGQPHECREGSPKIRPKGCDYMGLHQEKFADDQIGNLEDAIERWVKEADEDERMRQLSSAGNCFTPKAERLMRHLSAFSSRFERFINLARGKTPSEAAKPPEPFAAKAVAAKAVAPKELINPFPLIQRKVAEIVRAKGGQKMTEVESQSHTSALISQYQTLLEAWLKHNPMTDREVGDKLASLFRPFDY